MDMNVIKEYLISLGFHVDEDSLNGAKQNMSGVEAVIKNFASNNMENMSSMQSFFKLFNSSIKDNLGIVSKIVPEAKVPLLQVVSFAELLYRGIGKISQSLKGVKSDKIKEAQAETQKASNTMQNFAVKIKESQSPTVQLIALIKELTLAVDKLSFSLSNIKTPNKPVDIPKTNINNIPLQLPSSMPKEIDNTSVAMENLTKQSGNTSKALQEFKDTGNKNIKDFAENSGLSLKKVAIGFASFVATGVATWKMLSNLGQQDLGYQKLAMQLWTTTENAKEVSIALKTMKVSMQDLWLSPELLRQFNQLRQDSSQLKLPSDAEDNLKLVRSITFEFQRLKQAGSLAFQWIGYYISKYAAGPLANIHEALNSFVNWILKNIPNIAKVIGETLGIAFRLILTLIETISIAIQPIISLIELIGKGFDKLPDPIQKIIKLFILLGVVISTGPIGAIMILLAILDDLFTYMKGGHSVIGDFFNYFKEKGSSAVDTIKEKFKSIKNGLLDPIREIKEGWDSFWQSIWNFIDNIEKKFKTLEKDIKGSALGKILSKLIPDVSTKVQSFSKTTSSGKGTPISYLLPQTTNNKTDNSKVNHSSSQSNTFNIYGTNATSTATAVTSKLGISTRNLQGVID